jgi:hypothetical protein
MSEGPWRITMLGGLKAHCGDQSITPFATRKTGATLAILANCQLRTYLGNLTVPFVASLQSTTFPYQ